jgi:hypothetical protein
MAVLLRNSNKHGLSKRRPSLAFLGLQWLTQAPAMFNSLSYKGTAVPPAGGNLDKLKTAVVRP